MAANNNRLHDALVFQSPQAALLHAPLSASAFLLVIRNRKARRLCCLTVLISLSINILTS